MADEHWETECAQSPDKQHCACWYDGYACCYCGDPPDPEEVQRTEAIWDQLTCKSEGT